MAFFLPSHIQKRLLRYALSQLELVDTDALDLEQLEIAWGQRSSVELRDVGLHIQKISKLLGLPNTLQPTKGRIVSLKVTVPADLHRSGIQIEIRGVEVNVRVTKGEETVQEESQSPQDGGRGLDWKGKSRQHVGFDEKNETLPSAKDVAKAFLEVEPVEERRELEAAILSRSKTNLEESDVLSDSSDDALETGTGIGLALPGFLSGFLKGVADRLVITIKDVALLLDFEVSPEDISSPVRIQDDLPISLSLYVQTVDIEGLTSGMETAEDTSQLDQDQRNTPRKRQIILRTMRADLKSDSSFFASLSRVSSRALSQSSPALSRGARSPSPKSSSTSPMGSSFTQEPTHRRSLADTMRSNASTGGDAHVSLASDKSQRDLFEPRTDSIYREDRFADASDDEEVHGTYLADSMHLPSQAAPIENTASFIARERPSPLLASGGLSDSLRQPSFHGSSEPGSSGLLPNDEEAFALQNSELFSPRRITTSTHVLGSSDLSDSSQTAPFAVRSPSPGRLNYDRERDSGSSGTSSSPSSEKEDLTESRFFTHEDAQSMYHSALSEPGSSLRKKGNKQLSSQAKFEDHDNKIYTTSACSSTEQGIPNTQEETSCDTPKPASPIQNPISPASSETNQNVPFKGLKGDDARTKSRTAMVEDQADEQSSDGLTQVIKTFLTLDQLSVWVPWAGGHNEPASSVDTVDSISDNSSTYQSEYESLGYKGMPGAFSFDGTPDSRRTDIRRAKEVQHPSKTHKSKVAQTSNDPNSESVFLAAEYDSSAQQHDLDLELGTVQCQMDLSVGRLLRLLIDQLLQAPWPQKESRKVSTEASIRADAGLESSILLKAKAFSMSILEHLTSNFDSKLDEGNVSSLKSLTEPLLTVEALDTRLSFNKNHLLTAATLDFRKFLLGFPDENILSFNSATAFQGANFSTTNVRPNDISLKFVESKQRGREFHVATLPLQVSFSLQKLDDKLSCFGGLSGVLDLSSSIASNSTILAQSTRQNPRNHSKNVRFSPSQPESSAPTPPALKLNARLDGFFLRIDGRTCGISVQSSAVKAVVRDTGVSVGIGHIKIKSPLKEAARRSPLSVDIAKTQISFLFVPEESDLTQLVSLIMPTRDPYEDEDDILLDTLLRQRKKGSVVRGAISTIEIRVSELEAMQELQRLGEELSKLSNVTKYLPDDERPGILSLFSVEKIRTDVFVSRAVGSLLATCTNTRLAHVGLPALFALELGSLGLRRNEDELIQPVLLLREEDQLPMIMARIIGDELEPTIKVKLFNLGAEYRVSTLMAFMGLSHHATTEDLASSMASSVATIRDGIPSSGLTRQSSAVSDFTTRSSTKPLHLDLLLRDCAVGLNPDTEVSRGVILLTNARLSARATAKEPLKGIFDIRDCSILAIDDISLVNTAAEPAPRPRSANSSSLASSDICRQGYKILGSLSVSKAELEVEEDEAGKPLLNVTVTNKLLVLETCADSTQTLIQIIDGLKPPALPSSEIHYHTDPMLPEELMKAFSGAAYEQVESVTPDALRMDDDDDNLEGLSGAFEVVGSFYDPTGLQRNSVDARSRIYSPRQSVSSSRAHARATPFSRPSQLKFRHPSLNSPLNKASGHVHSSRNSGAMNAWNSAANRYGVLSGIGQKECPLRIKLSTGTFIWNLFDGYDWIKTQKTIAQAVEEVQIRAAKRRLNRQKLPAEEDDGESEIGDFLFQSIWIAVPPNRDEQDLRRQINREMDDLTSETSTVTTTAESRTTNRPVPKRNKSRALKLDRSKRRKVSFEIHELKVDVTVLPPGRTETQSSIDVRVGDLDIYDHVPSSTWRKFVTYMHDAGPRPYRKPMIHLELQTVKPKLDLAAIELVIRVTVSPLRLHVDQDTLDFITRFFEFKDDTRPASTDPAEPPFIQRCEVRAVPLKLDYKPKKVDYGGLRSGHTKEFMNFIILDGAEIQLKRIIVFGISGFDRLHKVLNDLWVTDVTRNQLPTVLQGLAPLRPLVNVGSGVRDLIVIPMREYQKDGRLVRSIQKGAVAFARTTTSEIARLGAKVAMGTGNILQGAESLLSPTSPNGPVTTEQDEEPSNASGRRAVSSYANQPLTVASGIRYAVRHLERDLMSTRDAIIAVGAEIRDSESATDVARAVFRSAPAVILKPAIGTSRAIGTALLGAGNALDKDSRRKAEDKYK